MNKKNVTKIHTIKIRVDDEFKVRLNQLCNKHKMNMSKYVRKLVDDKHLQDSQ